MNLFLKKNNNDNKSIGIIYIDHNLIIWLKKLDSMSENYEK